MEFDYRKTMFTVTLSDRPDRLYAITMTNGNYVMTENDDTLEGQIQDLLQGMAGYFEEHGAVGDQLVQLIMNNVKLCFEVEDMIPHDPTLKHMVEVGGLSSRSYFLNGIN